MEVKLKLEIGLRVDHDERQKMGRDINANKAVSNNHLNATHQCRSTKIVENRRRLLKVVLYYSNRRRAILDMKCIAPAPRGRYFW